MTYTQNNTETNKKGVDLLLVNEWFGLLDCHMLDVLGREEFTSRYQGGRGLVDISLDSSAYYLENVFVELPDYGRVYPSQCFVELAFWFAETEREFFDVGAFTQCDLLPLRDDGREYSDRQYERLNAYHESLIGQYEKREEFTFKDWYREIKIKPLVYGRDCYNNIPHNHFYEGIEISVSFMCDKEFQYLDSWLKSRYTWYNLAYTLFPSVIESKGYYPKNWRD